LFICTCAISFYWYAKLHRVPVGEFVAGLLYNGTTAAETSGVQVLGQCAAAMQQHLYCYTHERTSKHKDAKIVFAVHDRTELEHMISDIVEVARLHLMEQRVLCWVFVSLVCCCGAMESTCVSLT
jgi:hypothetical protein